MSEENEINNGNAVSNEEENFQIASETQKAVIPKIVQIELSELVPFKDHPFRLYEGERLEQFVKSIEDDGLLNPITVRKIADKKYEIISGHNRVKAYKILGYKKISAIIRNDLSTDEAAMKIVIDSNLHQQSFDEWPLSQQIKIIKIYSKYLQENSEQGKRNDKESKQPVSNLDTSPTEKQRGRKRRDKISEYLGISSTTFERFRSIAKLDEMTLAVLCMILDKMQITFMGIYRISQLKPAEITTTVDFLQKNTDFKLKGKVVERLYKASKASESELAGNAIEDILMREPEPKAE